MRLVKRTVRVATSGSIHLKRQDEVNHYSKLTTSSCVPSFVSRTSRPPLVVSACPGLILTIPTSVVLPPAITVPRLWGLLPPATPALVIHLRIGEARIVTFNSVSRPADAKSDPFSVRTTAAAAAATTTTTTSSVPISVPLPIPIVVSTLFPATAITSVFSVSIRVITFPVSTPRRRMLAVTATTRIKDDDVIVITHGHTREQARLAMCRRRVVALPSPSEPYLRVFLCPAATAATTAAATTTTTTRARAATALATRGAAVVPGLSVRVRISRPATAVVATLVPSVLEPVGRVVPLLFLQLERTLLHSKSVLVARALADVYWGARAPAVAERFVVFPVARTAGAHWPYGGV